MKPLHAINLLLVAALPLTAQTSTVVVPCDLDNTLFEDALGALSSGQGTSVFVGLPNVGGKRRALLRFNVASVLPPSARILGARLQINVAASSTAAPLAVTGHRVSSAWGEGASVADGWHRRPGANRRRDLVSHLLLVVVLDDARRGLRRDAELHD
jgi:hypothetical protein